jgi:iron(III) transport system substrate-binding protein
VKLNSCSQLLLCIGLLGPISAWSAESTEGNAKNQIEKKAQHEGYLTVYSVLSNKAAQPLVDGFSARYPGIKVDYDGEGGSTETYDRFIAESKDKKPTADVLWSSAMDLQMKLIADGFAAKYVSPEASHIPQWANYKDIAWGTTYEPVVMVYNKQLLKSNEVPTDHASFVQLLNLQQDRFKGKVTSFDLEKSGVGYMFAVQDEVNNTAWSVLQRALGQSKPFFAAGTGEMLKRINSGESILGYNIMGSYALSRSKKDLPNLGVSIPSDFAPILSRVMFINVNAAHPNAAKLWVDYVLSKEGQKIIGDSLELYAIREDAGAENSAQKLNLKIGSAARLIPVNEKLAETLRKEFQASFFQKWKKATFFQNQ